METEDFLELVKKDNNHNNHVELGEMSTSCSDELFGYVPTKLPHKRDIKNEFKTFHQDTIMRQVQVLAHNEHGFRSGAWAEEEQICFEEAVKVYGKDYIKIQSCVETRSV